MYIGKLLGDAAVLVEIGPSPKALLQNKGKRRQRAPGKRRNQKKQRRRVTLSSARKGWKRSPDSLSTHTR